MLVAVSRGKGSPGRAWRPLSRARCPGAAEALPSCQRRHYDGRADCLPAPARRVVWLNDGAVGLAPDGRRRFVSSTRRRRLVLAIQRRDIVADPYESAPAAVLRGKGRRLGPTMFTLAG
ncbi:hypothetical protein Scel_86450 [Streptomyces cellostaticus]|nr:hypothetical protein Scel_86450 [Streptomyces cellostaticus]